MARAILCLFLFIPAATQADDVLIPAELIHQLFQAEEPNKAIPKRSFSFSELETLLADRRFQDPARAKDLTRRYLAITYPAGLTSALDVARSELDEGVQEELFTAPPGSVRFAVPERLEEALDLLGLLSSKLAEALLAGSSTTVVYQLEKLDIAELLEISDKRFQQIVPYYRPNVTMQDVQKNPYLLSTPGRDHYLARLLEGTKAGSIECAATIEACKDDTCRTPKPGSSYASFKFENQGVWQVQPGDAFTAQCHYAKTFRREYTDHLEIEYRFVRCQLLTVNGETPVMDPLLQDLSRVQ